MIPAWRRLLQNHTLRLKISQRRPNVYAHLFAPLSPQNFDGADDDRDEVDVRDDELMQYDHTYKCLTLSVAMKTSASKGATMEARIQTLLQIIQHQIALASGGPMFSTPSAPDPNPPGEDSIKTPTSPLSSSMRDTMWNTVVPNSAFDRHCQHIFIKLPRDADNHINRVTFVTLFEHMYVVLLPGLTNAMARCLARFDFADVSDGKRTLSPQSFTSAMYQFALCWSAPSFHSVPEGLLSTSALSAQSTSVSEFVELMNVKLFDSKVMLVEALFSEKLLGQAMSGGGAGGAGGRNHVMAPAQPLMVHSAETPEIGGATPQPTQQQQPNNNRGGGKVIAHSGALGKAHSNWSAQSYHRNMPTMNVDIRRKIKVASCSMQREEDERKRNLAMTLLYKFAGGGNPSHNNSSSNSPVNAPLSGRRTALTPLHDRSDAPGDLLRHQWISQARRLGMSVRDFCTGNQLDLVRFTKWLGYEQPSTSHIRVAVRRFVGAPNHDGTLITGVEMDTSAPDPFSVTDYQRHEVLTEDPTFVTATASAALCEEWKQRALYEGLDIESFCLFYRFPSTKFRTWYADPNNGKNLSQGLEKIVTKYVFCAPPVQVLWKNCAERRGVSPVMFCVSRSFGLAQFKAWLEGGPVRDSAMASAVWEFLRTAGEEGTAAVNHRLEARPLPGRDKYSVEKAIGALPVRYVEAEVNACGDHRAVRSLMTMMTDHVIPTRHQAKIRHMLIHENESTKMKHS